MQWWTRVCFSKIYHRIIYAFNFTNLTWTRFRASVTLLREGWNVPNDYPFSFTKLKSKKLKNKTIKYSKKTDDFCIEKIHVWIERLFHYFEKEMEFVRASSIENLHPCNPSLPKLINIRDSLLEISLRKERREKFSALRDNLFQLTVINNSKFYQDRFLLIYRSLSTSQSISRSLGTIFW